LDVARRDGAVQTVPLAGRPLDRDLDRVELLRELLGFAAKLGRARVGDALFVLDTRDIRLARAHGQTPRDEVVAPVARPYLDELGTLAQMVHVLREDDVYVRSHGTLLRHAVTVKGKSAMLRARWIASVTLRWCSAQLPLIRRGTILPRSEMKYLS